MSIGATFHFFVQYLKAGCPISILILLGNVSEGFELGNIVRAGSGILRENNLDQSDHLVFQAIII